jgi:hypothetical protein
MRIKRNILKAVSCHTCNIGFTTYHIRKYCSSKCNPHVRQPFDKTDRICNQCGTPYTPIRRDQKYCKRTCNPYRKNSINPYYQTLEWKAIKAEFINSYTSINGILLSNRFCIECYTKQDRLNDMYAVDHRIRLTDGGTSEHSNLQSLCLHHHQSKSASEGNRERYNKSMLQHG